MLSVQTCTRAELAKILWPFSERKAQRNNLRAVLPHLRRALPVNAIEEAGDNLVLRHGAVIVDAWSIQGHDAYSGDFLPGFEQDWVIEKRLELRELACASAIKEAKDQWVAGGVEAALQLAKRAMEIDPLQDEAAALRVAWLEESGQRGTSAVVADAHRVRVLHDLGSRSPVRPSQDPQETHPLLVTAEWLLEFNPKSLLPFLVATHHEWPGLPVEAAIEMHERALAATSGEDTADRRLVRAQRVVLLVQAGRLGPHRAEAEHDLECAVNSGDHLVAVRLAGALSYGYLSLGEFAKANDFAALALACARRLSDPIVRFESEYLHTIISGHIGRLEESHAQTIRWVEEMDRVPSEMLRAGLEVSSVEALLASGRIDQASRQLERARSVYAHAGASRHIAWLHLSDALVSSALGDHASACESLQRTIKIGRRFAGHSAISMAEDRLAQVYCSMGAFDLAAESYAKSVRLRKSIGTVPSIPERPVIEKTRLLLHDKLGQEALSRYLTPPARL